MKLKTIGKRLITEPVSASLIQGENGVNRMEIHTPRTVDGTDLGGYVFKIRGNDSKGGLVEQVLEKEVKEAEIILLWEISARFTALAGSLALELIGLNPSGSEIVKFSAADITIRETLDVPPVDNPPAFEQALNDISVLQATRLSAENILAGKNISVTAEGGNVTVSASGAVIDDGNASAETVYSSEKLERDFAGRNAIADAVQSAVEEMELPVATAERLGCIKVGRNLTVEADGTLSAMASGGGGGSEIDDSAPSLVTVYSSAKVEADFAGKDEIISPDVDKAYVDGALSGKAEAVHSHSEYLTAESIAGLGDGDMKKSVYDMNGNGIVDNAEKVGGFTVGCNVPANAKFTDTNTTYGTVSTASGGLCPRLNGNAGYFLASDGQWRIPPDTNTTYGVATTSANGLAPRLNGNAGYFLAGNGTWQIPVKGIDFTIDTIFVGTPDADVNYTTEKPMTNYKIIVIDVLGHYNWCLVSANKNMFVYRNLYIVHRDETAYEYIFIAEDGSTFKVPRKLGHMRIYGIN